MDYIDENFPNAAISTIERNHWGPKYRIRFHKTNDIELSFTDNGILVKTDTLTKEWLQMVSSINSRF